MGKRRYAEPQVGLKKLNVFITPSKSISGKATDGRKLTSSMSDRVVANKDNSDAASGYSSENIRLPIDRHGNPEYSREISRFSKEL